MTDLIVFANEAVSSDVNTFGAQIFNLLPIIIVGFAFYFMIVRPQKVRIKKHQEFIQGIQVGEHVFTKSGMIGKIVHIDHDTVRLQVSDNTEITLLKEAIQDSYKDNVDNVARNNIENTNTTNKNNTK